MDGMFFRSTFRAATILLTFSLLGCSGDDISGPSRELADGMAQFEYSGPGGAGAFNVVGRFERDGNGAMIAQPFATGIDVTLPDFRIAYYGIIAADFYLPELDELSIILSGQTPGEYPILPFPDCGLLIETGGGPCATVSFGTQLDINGNYSARATSYEFDRGVVEVAEVSKDRIKGSFSGTAHQLSPPYSASRYKEETDVVIDGGTFDVPIISLTYWNGEPNP